MCHDVSEFKGKALKPRNAEVYRVSPKKGRYQGYIMEKKMETTF